MSEDDKVATTIKSEIGRELVILSADGKEMTYYRNPIRTMELIISELAVNRSFQLASSFLDDDLGTPPDLSTAVTGVATLDRRSTLSVIGYPARRAQHFSIRFTALSEGQRAEREQLAKSTGKAPRYTGVSVGFVPQDWEIGNDESWFIAAEVSPQLLRELEAEVRAGRVNSLRLGLHLQNIYTDDDWAPPSVSADWYLRSTDAMPTGEISQFIMDVAPMTLAPEPVAAERQIANDEEDPDRTAQPLVVSAPVPAALAGAVERLERTVRWVGGSIAFLLLLGLVK